MSEDEIITEIYSLLHINTYINLCEQMELSVKIPKIILKKWKDNCNRLLDLYQQEKEKNKTLEELLQGRLFESYNYYKDLAGSYQANCISKDKIKAKIKELEEEQKEYKGGQEWEIQDDIDAQINILKELLKEN